MKKGDLVYFPCEAMRYKYVVGVLIAIRDNPADVSSKNPSRPKKPRQVADILYEGKIDGCWAHHLKEVKDEDFWY